MPCGPKVSAGARLGEDAAEVAAGVVARDAAEEQGALWRIGARRGRPHQDAVSGAISQGTCGRIARTGQETLCLRGCVREAKEVHMRLRGIPTAAAQETLLCVLQRHRESARLHQLEGPLGEAWIVAPRTTSNLC